MNPNSLDQPTQGQSRIALTGTLWEGRFRSCLTQEDKYLLGCYRYIELNPVRANRVVHPVEYPWSSYHANAQGESSKLLTPLSLYLSLGRNVAIRQSSNRKLFRHLLDPKLIDEIRTSSNGNYTLESYDSRNKCQQFLNNA